MRGPSGGPVTAGDLLTLEELTHLRRTSARRGAALVLHAWGVIAGAIALYVLRPSLLTLGVVVLVIGARQLGLMVLMHEAAHWLLFPGGRMNTWVGTWLCAAPLGIDLKAYRRRHHLHHRHTQTTGDPDLALSPRLPLSRGRLALAALGDLSGWTALTRIAGWRPWRDGAALAWRRSRAPLAANVALGAVLTAIGGWQLYLLAWVLPWATWLQLLTRIRDIAEHGLVDGPEDPLRNSRSIAAGPLARAFLAPYGVNHHLEHHLLVFVPCWKLAEVSALLLARNLGERMERAASYATVLAGATWPSGAAGPRSREGTGTRGPSPSGSTGRPSTGLPASG
jgi:fatty acid desaturase